MMVSAVYEEWRAVVGHEGRYEVSSLGNLRSLRFRSHRGASPMTPTPNYAGYRVVTLGRGRKQYRVAVLVLEAFVGPRPAGMEACHGALGNQCDAVSNLRWDTQEANNAERNLATGDRNSKTKLTDDQRRDVAARRRGGETCTSLAAEFGITPTRVVQLAKDFNK